MTSAVAGTVAAGVPPAVELGVSPGGMNDDIATTPESSSADQGGKMPPSTAGGTPAATMASLLAALFLSFIVIPFAALAQPFQLPKLLPPHGEIGPTFWEVHHWQIIITTVVILALVSLLVVWLRRPKPVVITPPVVVARRALEALRGRGEDGVLLVEVSRIVRHYAISVFMLPPDELTTAEFLQALQSRSQIDAGLVATIHDFLRQCDERKFSPVPVSSAGDLLHRATALVETIEKHQQPSIGNNVPPPQTANVSTTPS